MSRSVVELLKAARDASLLKRSEFGCIFAPKPGDNDYCPYPTCEDEVTAFIKARTRLHHQTWITGPIEEALAIIQEQFMEGKYE